jgi:DNA-binding NtrC family response regulator
VKLLRVLENQSFFRVGGTQPIRVNVRVIAATNRSLKEQVSLGEFRDDLYYRLNVLYMYLPPLRERKSDIPLLIKRFVRELSERHGRTFPGFSPEAVQILVNAHWPGNVRELRNLIESIVVLAHGREITPADLPRDVREGGTRLLPARVPSATAPQIQGHEMEFIFRSLVELKLQIEQLRRRIDESPQRVELIDVGGGQPYEEVRSERIEGDSRPFAAHTLGAPDHEPVQEVIYRPGMKMADVEKAAIVAALRDTRGNRRKAAEVLEIGERTLYRKIKEYGLE